MSLVEDRSSYRMVMIEDECAASINNAEVCTSSSVEGLELSMQALHDTCGLSLVTD